MLEVKNLKSVGLLLLLGLIFSLDACVHELPQPNPDTGGDPPTISDNCSTDTVYFEQAILPLVTTLCGKSGCHGTIKRNSFQLVYSSSFSSYNSIKNRFISSTNPTSYSKLDNALNKMAGQKESDYVEPTTQQLSTLTTWISQGAQYNSCTSCDTTQFTFMANISPTISNYCVSCHPSPGSSNIPDLTTYTAIQAELNNYPERLMKSIQHAAPYNTPTTAMPQNTNKLNDCYIEQIHKWIDAGAPNN